VDAASTATFETAMTTIDHADPQARAALKAGVISGNVKAWVESLGITWPEWRALPVPARDRLTLRAYRG
jgi:hypothetical protein